MLHSVRFLITSADSLLCFDSIYTALMAKSKALRKERQPGGDDFSLQSKRRLSLRAVRVSSRSCSPEQSPSPTHTKHHSMATLAEFVNLFSESKVLSSQRGKAMASLNPSASSSPCSADFVCDSD